MADIGVDNIDPAVVNMLNQSFTRVYNDLYMNLMKRSKRELIEVSEIIKGKRLHKKIIKDVHNELIPIAWHPNRLEWVVDCDFYN